MKIMLIAIVFFVGLETQYRQVATDEILDDIPECKWYNTPYIPCQKPTVEMSKCKLQLKKNCKE